MVGAVCCVTARAFPDADAGMTTAPLPVLRQQRRSLLLTAATATPHNASETRPAFNARALHLIDLENLVGGPSVSDTTIKGVWSAYYGGVPKTASDQLLVGSSRFFARRIWWTLPEGIQRRVRDGQDGGELAILAEVDLDHLVERFGRLVIASGDGRFAELAAAARSRGVHVHQVTGIGLPSRALMAEASSRSRLKVNVRSGGPSPLDIPARPLRAA